MKLVTKPSPCFITPTAYLEKYASQSNNHLCLAHIVDRDPVYADFYKKMSDRGDLVIMDNSAFELLEPYSPDKLFELGKKCGAHVLVLPDYPFKKGEVTIEAAKKYIPIFKGAGFKTFFVPQSETGDLEDYIATYKWAAENPDVDVIGCSILGMPNALPNIPKAYARVVMTQLLIDRGVFNFDKHHHYLGLNAGPNLEIPALLKMKALDTTDSSGAFWFGLNGHKYSKTLDSYTVVKELVRPVDFNEPWHKSPAIHDAIQNNIDLTKELFDINNK